MHVAAASKPLKHTNNSNVQVKNVADLLQCSICFDAFIKQEATPPYEFRASSFAEIFLEKDLPAESDRFLRIQTLVERIGIHKSNRHYNSFMLYLVRELKRRVSPPESHLYLTKERFEAVIIRLKAIWPTLDLVRLFCPEQLEDNLFLTVLHHRRDDLYQLIKQEAVSDKQRVRLLGIVLASSVKVRHRYTKFLALSSGMQKEFLVDSLSKTIKRLRRDDLISWILYLGETKLFIRALKREYYGNDCFVGPELVSHKMGPKKQNIIEYLLDNNKWKSMERLIDVFERRQRSLVSAIIHSCVLHPDAFISLVEAFTRSVENDETKRKMVFGHLFGNEKGLIDLITLASDIREEDLPKLLPFIHLGLKENPAAAAALVVHYSAKRTSLFSSLAGVCSLAEIQYLYASIEKYLPVERRFKMLLHTVAQLPAKAFEDKDTESFYYHTLKTLVDSGSFPTAGLWPDEELQKLWKRIVKIDGLAGSSQRIALLFLDQLLKDESVVLGERWYSYVKINNQLTAYFADLFRKDQNSNNQVHFGIYFMPSKSIEQFRLMWKLLDDDELRLQFLSIPGEDISLLIALIESCNRGTLELKEIDLLFTIQSPKRLAYLDDFQADWFGRLLTYPYGPPRILIHLSTFGGWGIFLPYLIKNRKKKGAAYCLTKLEEHIGLKDPQRKAAFCLECRQVDLVIKTAFQTLSTLKAYFDYMGKETVDSLFDTHLDKLFYMAFRYASLEEYRDLRFYDSFCFLFEKFAEAAARKNMCLSELLKQQINDDIIPSYLLLQLHASYLSFLAEHRSIKKGLLEELFNNKIRRDMLEIKVKGLLLFVGSSFFGRALESLEVIVYRYLGEQKRADLLTTSARNETVCDLLFEYDPSKKSVFQVIEDALAVEKFFALIQKADHIVPHLKNDFASVARAISFFPKALPRLCRYIDDRKLFWHLFLHTKGIKEILQKNPRDKATIQNYLQEDEHLSEEFLAYCRRTHC